MACCAYSCLNHGENLLDNAQELLYKFENWDDIVDKRSLLKYEELRGEKEKAKVRRFAGIGQVIDEGQSTVKKASQIYGMGHGLKGWFGEDVAQR